jgi:hypothetical protein
MVRGDFGVGWSVWATFDICGYGRISTGRSDHKYGLYSATVGSGPQKYSQCKIMRNKLSLSRELERERGLQKEYLL